MKATDDGKYPFITNPNYCSPAWQKQRIRWWSLAFWFL
jgi:hypothetical protein